VRIDEYRSHLQMRAKKRHFMYVLYQLYTVGIEYAARQLLPISRVHVGKVQKSCLFNLSTVFA